MRSLFGGPQHRRLVSVSTALKIVAAFFILLVCLAAWYEIAASRSAIISETERQMSRLDMVFAEQTGRAVEAVDLLVGSAMETVQLHLVQNHSLAGVDDLLRRRIGSVRQLRAVTVLDADGHVLVGTDPGTEYAPGAIVGALLARYRADPKAGLLISTPFQGADRHWYALLSRPMRHDGTLNGLAVGTIALNYFEDFYRAVELSENGAINLHLRDGTLLARFPHDDAIIGTSYGDLPPFKNILSKEMAGTLVMDSPLDGNTRVVAIRALKAFPLAVMVSVEQGRVLLDWRHGAYALVVVALALGGLVVFLLLTLARRSQQIEHLLEQAHHARMTAEQASNRMMQQIAERERTEAKLRQAQRIEAIGQLTGGVAHDFNNLLTVVLGNVDILQRRAAVPDGAMASRLDAIRSAAQRGATLTSHLLSFARRQPLMPKPVDLNDTIRGMQNLLDSAVGPRARIRLDLAADLWPAMVDQSQVELLILNLVINARDALAEPGTITIATANTFRAPSSSPDAPPAGDYVRIVVRDTGVGIPPDVLAHVFEPFFTTKAPGAGSGLGLSQVFGTARQSGGAVKIESDVGQGTVVTVDLPRALVEPAGAAVVDAVGGLRGSTGTILLVDDDDAVRAVAATMLADLGYTVREAGSGESALAMLERDGAIDVLMTDLVMPGMNGSQLAAAARERRPDLPVLFVSGYADPLDEAWSLNHPLIRKPFGAADLHRAVEAALAERREAVASSGD
ncbi:MAG TPA: ATP-binding protein [Rhodopila sp.]|uniref:hybrid sensor histidine kinase/response regulator n=1 Tax=Rhodopila sp. TaxID=2480087 RepID=UPI002C111091|nr:ATP-binding protein [Rhodopila sp.]HVY17678.1 ATP-binding protein [Rhodopila sp.]